MAKKKTVPLPPVPEIRDFALTEIQKTAAPVTAKQISGFFSAPKISEAVLVPILDEAVAMRLLHSFPPATAKGKPRYWDRDFVEWGRSQIVMTIQTKGPQPITKLKSAAKGFNETQFKQAFQNLLDAGRIREHPPVGKSRSSKYGTQPPECEPYLQDVAKTLAKIVRQLIEAGVNRDALSNTIWVRLNEMGLSLPANPSVAESSIQTLETEINLSKLMLLMRQIEPGAERGALVTSRELRRAANLEKIPFDQMVLELARQGQLMLHRHDFAAGLSPSDRDELVTDGAGNYYVGMALRRMEG